MLTTQLLPESWPACQLSPPSQPPFEQDVSAVAVVVVVVAAVEQTRAAVAIVQHTLTAVVAAD